MYLIIWTSLKDLEYPASRRTLTGGVNKTLKNNYLNIIKFKFWLSRVDHVKFQHKHRTFRSSNKKGGNRQNQSPHLVGFRTPSSGVE